METKITRAQELGGIPGFLSLCALVTTLRGNNDGERRVHSGDTKYLRRAAACPTIITQCSNIINSSHHTST